MSSAATTDARAMAIDGTKKMLDAEAMQEEMERREGRRHKKGRREGRDGEGTVEGVCEA